jgi:type IV secretion system protein VirD4
MPALAWLTSPAATTTTTGGTALDVAELVRQQGTVYLLGGEEGHVAPLVTALTGHIARQARRLAAQGPTGRLDPPLTLVLDEAALICPVPLDQWTADMGGRGVSIVAAFQSRAQLAARWGEVAARVILNNAGAVVLFSLGADTDDLRHWSALAGERDEPVTTHDPTGSVTSQSTRKVPVIAPTQLTNLPTGRVVVFRRGMPPVVGRVRMAWKRPDVKAHAKRARQAAHAVVTEAVHVTQAVPSVGEPSRTTSPASPVPAQSWLVDTRGVTRPLGDRPVTTNNSVRPLGDSTPGAGDATR